MEEQPTFRSVEDLLNYWINYSNKDTLSNIEFYNKVDPNAYDQMNVLINFSEVKEIAKKIYTPVEEGGLGIPKEANIFDCGMGTGMMGVLLNKEGYTEIEGVDASQRFL